MLRFVKWIGIALLLAIGGLIIAAALRPDDFVVSRSRVIEAPPERLFPLIEDLRAFNTWNPFVAGDTEMPLSYEGAVKGAGAVNRFGPGKGGAGTLSVVAVEPPSHVAMKLDMVAPIEAHNDIDFRLQPEGTGTRVTWSMRGRVPFLAKILHVVIDMDSMVGGQMQTGLAALARKTEK